MKEEIENRKDEKRMNKNVIGLIIAIIVIIVSVAVFAIYRNSNTNTDNNNISENLENSEQDEIQSEENAVVEESTKDVASNGNKVLVVYYSAQNHTKSVAEKIAKNMNADIFEIIPEDIYTDDDLDWSNSNSRVSKEHNDESLRNIELKTTSVNNWEEYDTVLIGYPIWWGVAAWPINNFVKDNDFTGKTVIPFCTSASSGIGQSDTLLKGLTNTGNWMNGHRFSSSASDSVIKEFTDSIK